MPEPPTYPLADALRWGVPAEVSDSVVRREGYSGWLSLTRSDGPPVRFYWDGWPPGPGGTWYAKGTHRGRTLTGYAGGHRPRGGGIAGLSAEGIRRALDGIERQREGWESGRSRRRVYRPCPTCGRPLPLAT